MTIKVALLKSRAGNVGGLEKATAYLAEAFLKRGVEITLLTTCWPEERVSRYKVVSFDPAPKITSVRKLYHFNKACTHYLNSHSFDIVFGLDRNPFQTHYRAGSGVHKAFLERRIKAESFFKKISFSINPFHKQVLRLEKQAFEDPSLKLLVTNSNMVKEEVLRYYTTSAQKIQVVPNGVEWKNYEPFFLKRSSSMETFRFLFIGNGYQRKGLDFLLYALSLINNYDFHLTVVGKDKSLNKYKKLAELLNLTSKLTFKGPLSSTFDLYQETDCVVIPSLYDPFANVTVEALAMGIPVLSSKDNGGSEILTPSLGSVIPDVSDQYSFSSSLVKMMETTYNKDEIRGMVSHLDSAKLMDNIVEKCLQ
jgi:UDP-glucose:(heptosyl)LPS alpha-1,3-glucosyltransferase